MAARTDNRDLQTHPSSEASTNPKNSAAESSSASPASGMIYFNKCLQPPFFLRVGINNPVNLLSKLFFTDPVETSFTLPLPSLLTKLSVWQRMILVDMLLGSSCFRSRAEAIAPFLPVPSLVYETSSAWFNQVSSDELAQYCFIVPLGHHLKKTPYHVTIVDPFMTYT